MLNEFETAMKKQSRNFGFMRPKCEQLAEAGASVEMHAHDDDPLTALSEARRFAEGLLKFYVRHRSDEREPDGFEALLDVHRNPIKRLGQTQRGIPAKMARDRCQGTN